MHYRVSSNSISPIQRFMGMSGGDLQLALWKKQQNHPCQSLSSILLGTFLSHCCRVLCHGIHIHSTESQPQPNGGIRWAILPVQQRWRKKERITKEVKQPSFFIYLWLQKRTQGVSLILKELNDWSKADWKFKPYSNCSQISSILQIYTIAIIYTYIYLLYIYIIV